MTTIYYKKDDLFLSVYSFGVGYAVLTLDLEGTPVAHALSGDDCRELAAALLKAADNMKEDT